MRKKKYIPKARHNPEYQARKIENSSIRIDNLDKSLKALSAVHDDHIKYLGNFARHDIKNSIQSMDSILSTTSPTEMTEEKILSLKANLKVIRETMDNFSKLVPYSKDKNFTLKNLIIASELLTRNEIDTKRIIFTKEIPKEYEIYLNLPFQSILQMFNNLVKNSIKSLEGISNPIIHLSTRQNESFLIIDLSDNGKTINDGDLTKIFDFGYSTTGGSGIGLYHAKYLCENFKGKIEVSKTNEIFSKTFSVYLPIIPQDLL